MGLRYEFSTLPIERFGNNWVIINLTNPATTTGTDGQPFINPYYKNFSPRVGLAWDVTGNGKTSVRASFGKYFDIANSAFTLYSAQATPPISGNYSPPTVRNGRAHPQQLLLSRLVLPECPTGCTRRITTCTHRTCCSGIFQSSTSLRPPWKSP